MSKFGEIEKLLMLDVLGPDDGMYLCGDKVIIPRCDLEDVADLIYRDGFDMSGFKVGENLGTDCIEFRNRAKGQYFLVLKEDDKWQFAYQRCGKDPYEHYYFELADSIEEAVNKTEWFD